MLSLQLKLKIKEIIRILCSTFYLTQIDKQIHIGNCNSLDKTYTGIKFF